MSWGSLEERTEFMRTLDHPRLTLLILAHDATWKVSGQWVCTLWMRIKRGFICVYVFAPKNMELGCTEMCAGCFMDFNYNIMLLSIAVNMQSVLVKVVQELKIRNNFVCSHILRTSDSCCHGAAKHYISVVPCLCWVWWTVVTLPWTNLTGSTSVNQSKTEELFSLFK